MDVASLKKCEKAFALLKVGGISMPYYVSGFIATKAYPILISLLILTNPLYVLLSYVSYLFLLARSSQPPDIYPTAAVPSPFFSQIVLLIVLAVMFAWPALTACCCGYDLLRNSHVDELFQRIAAFPRASVVLREAFSRFERTALGVLATSMLLQIALGIVAGSVTDGYGQLYAAIGTVLLMLTFVTLCAVTLVLAIVCEAHTADFNEFTAAVKSGGLPVRIARKDQRVMRTFLVRTSEVFQNFSVSNVLSTTVLLVLWIVLLLFSPHRSDFTRAMFAIPVILQSLVLLVALRCQSRVTSAMARATAASAGGFLEESVERRSSLALSMAASGRGGMQMYGVTITSKLLTGVALTFAVALLVLLQRLLAMMRWTR
eukprot:TRINITY_DN10272_c0_g1_i1.p1 TRINITY_DN10272_c0_g1~~TRINITY_DN10272_c0_g1_i1.p1  ORF type:complete len:390 (-),score=62.27 TRINITY_DN10272_c0_g1_i1:799-1920(-)